MSFVISKRSKLFERYLWGLLFFALENSDSFLLRGDLRSPRECVVRSQRLGTSRAPDCSNVNTTVAAMRHLLTSTKVTSDEELAWFARDRRCDAVAAANKYEKWLQWHSNWGGLAKDRTALRHLAYPEKRKRVGYIVSTRDVLGRPVVIVVARRHSTSRRRLQSSQALCIDVLEDAVAACDHTVEQFITIIDLRGVGPDQVDLKFIYWLITTLRNYYPKRLGQVAIMDPPTVLFQTAWSIIEPTLGKHAAMVRLVSATEVRRSYFHPADIPQELR